MARIVFSNYERTLNPAWIGDVLDRDHNLAGGAIVDATKFTAGSDGTKFIPSGTLLGRDDLMKGFEPFRYTVPQAGEDPEVPGHAQMYLLLHDVIDAAIDPEIELYRHGSLVKTNYLPTASKTVPALAEIAKRYEVTTGN